ncbi:MAG: ABC transporter ATP-binding protein [Gemmatimonadetes bacterium]|nr:MAG: ABC transporter ATP-binding protein [Gemmatimonadota bacterium]
MTNAIELEHLRYHPGKGFEIRDLDLHVPAGSIYGFLGPNGSGKTTTIRLVLGLLRPQAGQITVLGERMPDDAPRVLARVGYVPEQPHLDPTLTVRETMNFQAAFYPTWDGPRAEQLLGQFQLDEQRLFGRLSKGQKAKLMILLALAQRGELLVLDEPTDGLDPVVRRDILAALLEYVAQRRATIFISSHLVHELERICDWVAVMDDGRLVTEEPMDKLKNGTKRLRVAGARPPAALPQTPFVLLAREPAANGGGETWIVRDWRPEMTAYFETIGATLQDVIDLDLEDSFVELLRTFRAPAQGG